MEALRFLSVVERNANLWVLLSMELTYFNSHDKSGAKSFSGMKLVANDTGDPELLAGDDHDFASATLAAVADSAAKAKQRQGGAK